MFAPVRQFVMFAPVDAITKGIFSFSLSMYFDL